MNTSHRSHVTCRCPCLGEGDFQAAQALRLGLLHRQLQGLAAARPEQAAQAMLALQVGQEPAGAIGHLQPAVAGDLATCQLRTYQNRWPGKAFNQFPSWFPSCSMFFFLLSLSFFFLSMMF